MTVNPVYQYICPSCGREADVESILEYGVCRKCLLGERGTGYNLLRYNESILEEIHDFEEFFYRATRGYRLWGSQKIWLKRLFSRENIAVIAPTGIGKTTLLTAYALYMSQKYGMKILFLSPTTSLARQVYTRLNIMASNTNSGVRILFYNSNASKSRREEVLEKIKNGEYDILVLTNAFLSRRIEFVRDKRFDIVIADDVDSLLNRSKNIVRLLKLLGYSDEEIAIARELCMLRNKLLVYRVNGLEKQYIELFKKYIDVENRLRDVKNKHLYGQIVIASATGRARGPYMSILRELLELDITGITVYARDITDSYVLVKNSSEVASILKDTVSSIGRGGIILISSYHLFKKQVQVDTIIEEIKSMGYRVSKATPSSIKKLVDGEIDVIVGSASYYGVSVRGIDSPENIRYVVFIGTPCFSIELASLLSSVKLLYRTLLFLRDKGYSVGDYIRIVSSILRYATYRELRVLKELLRDRLSIDDISNKRVIEWYNSLREVVGYVESVLREIIDREEVVSIGTITLCRNGGKYVALIPDLMTYIQASGRTSRLYNGGMTHGLSIVIEYDKLYPLLKSLETRFKYLNKEVVFKPLKELCLDKEKELIHRSRSRGRGSSILIDFKNILLVVESPTKAKTIAGFFGKPARRRIGSITVYEVPLVRNNQVLYLNIMATRGHIFDLTTDPSVGVYGLVIDGRDYKPYYTTIKRCRICGYQFTHGSSCIRCGSTSITDSIEVVNVLRKLASEVDEVLIATDPDNEGEKIAFDIYLVVKPINNNVYRVEFHEVTPRELYRVFDNRRSIDFRLVYSQILRRLMDRLIGFSLSHRLWSVFGKHWLGAGRVQTPVLGWIIDRYRLWRENRCYVVDVVAGIEKPFLRIRFYVGDSSNARELVKKIKETGCIELELASSSIEVVNPKPPYTTDSLLQDLGRQGIPATKAMKILQDLFESGLITYHRTDSTYVSSTGIGIAKKYLEANSIKQYFTPRHWGEKGTHEAIRPTNPWDRSDLEKAISEGLINIPVYLTPLHLRVYDIVFKRFIASQMKPYRVLVKKIIVSIDKYSYEAVLPVDIIEDGFNVVDKPVIYRWLNRVDGKISIPVQGVVKKKTSRKPLLSHGEVVMMMKKEGIGRPSTYASILATIRRHGYVIESKKRHYLVPTKTGIKVYNYLISNYRGLVSVSTTRFMESLIDRISEGVLEPSRAIEIVLEKLGSYRLLTIDKSVVDTAIEAL